MTRDELAARVQAIHERHDTLVGPGHSVPGNTGDGVGQPPSDEETMILLLDKCVATADAFGIKTEPSQWTVTGPGRFEFPSGDMTFVFDGDLGMMVTAEHRSTPIDIHDPADLGPAVAEVVRPEPETQTVDAVEG